MEVRITNTHFVNGLPYFIVAGQSNQHVTQSLSKQKNYSIVILVQTLARSTLMTSSERDGSAASIRIFVKFLLNWLDPSPTHVSDIKTGLFMLETVNVVLLSAYMHALFFVINFVLTSLVLTSCLV